MRKGILPGNSKTLWHAVKIAKNQGPPQIPKNVHINNVPVASHEVSESFAKFFKEKVCQIVSSTRVKLSVHNGTRKMEAEDSVFMTGNKINECIMDQKLKNTEGYARLPQRILIDGRVYI